MSFLTTMFVLWLLGCFVAAMIADSKGRSIGGFFAFAFFFLPLIGIIAAAIASPLQATTPVVINQSQPSQPRTGNGTEDHVAILERLVKLKETGIITEEEFSIEKNSLLHKSES